MQLQLNRLLGSESSTTGELLIDGKFFCYTLEDVEREAKIFGVTAIPKGEYKVALTLSPRFKQVLPLLLDVPGYTGVRIHSGNTADDTEGCILVGDRVGKGFLYNSRNTLKKLLERLENQKEITIKIK